MIRLLTAVLVLVIAWSMPGRGETAREICERYSRDAISYQQQNLELGCGLSGPEWNAEYRYHFDWCVNGNNYRSAARWTEFRRAKIAQCREAADLKGQQDKPARQVAQDCERYAAEAVAQQEANRQRSCGFSGPEWKADYNYHYNWCVEGVNAQSAAQWTQWRRDKISACVASAAGQKTSSQAWSERLPPLVKQVMSRLDKGMARLSAKLKTGAPRWQKYTPLDMKEVIASAQALSQAGQYAAFEREQKTLLGSGRKVPKNLHLPPAVKSVVTAPEGNVIEPGTAVLVTGANFGAAPGRVYLVYKEDAEEFGTPKVQQVELLPFRSSWEKSWFGNLILARAPAILPGRMSSTSNRPGELMIVAEDGTSVTARITVGSGRPEIHAIKTVSGGKTIRPGEQFALIGRNFGASRGKGGVELTLGGGRKKQWLQIQGTTSFVHLPIPGNDAGNALPAPDVRLRVESWTDNHIVLTVQHISGGRYTEAASGVLVVKNSNDQQDILHGVNFDTGNGVRVVSGAKWWDRRNSGKHQETENAMLVTHVPDCGAYSGEKGFDSFLRDVPMPEDIEIFRVDFREIDPDDPYADVDFFLDQMSALVDAVLGGVFGVARYVTGKVVAAILSSAGGYHANVSILPDMKGSGLSVGWETACALGGKPIMYVISFSIAGRPEALAKY